MRLKSQTSNFLVNIWFKRCRKKVLGPSGSILGFEIVKTYRRHNLDDIERAVAHHGAGQFEPGNVSLAQHIVAERPILARELLRRGPNIPPYRGHPPPRPPPP